jgi:hypothetical protein
MTDVEIPVEEHVEEHEEEISETPVVTEIPVPVSNQNKEYTKKEKEQIKKDLLEGKEHSVYELKKHSNGSFRLEKKRTLTNIEKQTKDQTEKVVKQVPKQAYMTDTQLLWQNYSELKTRMDTENQVLRQKLKKYKKRFNELFEDDIEEIPLTTPEHNVEPVQSSGAAAAKGCEHIQETIPQTLQPLPARRGKIYRSKFRS